MDKIKSFYWDIYLVAILFSFHIFSALKYELKVPSCRYGVNANTIATPITILKVKVPFLTFVFHCVPIQ